MAKNWMAKLAKLDGAIADDYNPFSSGIQSPCPSLNFAFGNTWRLPFGYSLVLWGGPKCGKSLIANSMAGQLHKDDPDAIVIKFDTEFRDRLQMTDAAMAKYGIDKDRYMPYEVNHPALIFDRIENEIVAMCQDGMPLKLIIIDSLNNIQGRRSTNADSIMVQQIGDDAKTIQDGLKRILPLQRKYKFSVILIAQQRAEMDQTEQMRGRKFKMAASWATKHYAEYFMHVDRLENKKSKTDLTGAKFEDEEHKDTDGKAESTGHKIRAVMQDNSVGPKGRTAILTFDYNRGFINQHEEVFLLAKNRGILQQAGAWYTFGEKRWNGEKAASAAFAADNILVDEVLREIKAQDAKGAFKAQDAVAADKLEVPE